MNKENAISKINSIGKAGRILSKIAMIALMIGCIAVIVSGILFLAIPKEDFAFKMNNDATLTVNMDSKMVGSLTSAKQDAESLPQGSTSINGVNYSFEDVTFEQDGKIANFKLQGDGATITSGRIAAI